MFVDWFCCRPSSNLVVGVWPSKNDIEIQLHRRCREREEMARRRLSKLTVLAIAVPVCLYTSAILVILELG
jgi:hypothetical protein